VFSPYLRGAFGQRSEEIEMDDHEEPRLALIARIVRDTEWYPRAKLDAERVEVYAADYRERGPEALPPIQVGLIPGIDGLWLVNGWHRTAAAEAAGLTELMTAARAYPDRWAALADAVWIANRGELSLRPGEKGRSVDTFLRQFPETSDRKLASELGVSHVYVWKRRQQLDQTVRVPDALREQARALLRAWAKLGAGQAPGAATAESGLPPVIEALALAAARIYASEADVWLERLEAALRQGRQRLAAPGAGARTAGPSSGSRSGVNQLTPGFAELTLRREARR